jgi:hypothetical protein
MAGESEDNRGEGERNGSVIWDCNLVSYLVQWDIDSENIGFQESGNIGGVGGVGMLDDVTDS